MKAFAIAVSAVLVLGACAPAAKPAATSATASKPGSTSSATGSGSWNVTTGKTAAASLVNAEGKNVGTVTFAETAGGVRAIVRVFRLPAGKYIASVHSGTDCADAGSGVKFGGAGELFQGETGNLEGLNVPSTGTDTVSTLNPRLTVAAGPNSVVGRVVLVKTDKLRVACGAVISAD